MFIYWFCSSLILCFPLFKNPISMAAMLVAISLVMVVMISVVSSFWFSYVLFLVYVGGLLVLFIYICLVSSNYPFKFNLVSLLCIMMTSCLISLKSESSYPSGILGSSTWVSGENLMNDKTLSLFLFLAILLLTMLLVVVRICEPGGFSVTSNSNEKN
uniref:NADH dehydrogenase subunit 6 n=1 Tax=Phyllidia picta TaxID=1481448 RepID=UPI002A7FA986|nr:NADH dehydrogenase subunit 6 [Phyllidia picta]WNR50656.1 NADH dehydrogenase subunit 6 [Phyllidia picta]